MDWYVKLNTPYGGTKGTVYVVDTSSTPYKRTPVYAWDYCSHTWDTKEPKIIAEEVGVPVAPWSRGAVDTLEGALAAAEQIGWVDTGQAAIAAADRGADGFDDHNFAHGHTLSAARSAAGASCILVAQLMV